MLPTYPIILIVIISMVLLVLLYIIILTSINSYFIKSNTIKNNNYFEITDDNYTNQRTIK